MSTAQNNVIKPGRKLECVRSTSVAYNQGDLLYSNSTVATPCTTADTHTRYLLGVALNSNPVTPTPYGDSVYPDYAEVDFGGVYEFATTAGETYAHEALVNITAAQTVTTTAGTYPVGRVYNPEAATITGATGVKVKVRIFNRSIAPDTVLI